MGEIGSINPSLLMTGSGAEGALISSSVDLKNLSDDVTDEQDNKQTQIL